MMLLQVIGLLALLVEGHCLRVEQSGRQMPDEGAGAVALSREEEISLPPPAVLRSLWEEKVKLEDAHAKLPDKQVQLVLGLFASQKGLSADVKDINLKTWMNRPGVCWLQKGQRKGCTVYTAYVLGTRNPAQYVEDELVLNVSENMNTGKSFHYFQQAAALYPWATHLAKMDLDTFPYIHRLTWGLADRATPQCHLYVGHLVDHNECGRFSHCPPPQCHHPVEGHFLIFPEHDPAIQCWSYMQGGLYLMSTELARAVTTDDPYWSSHLGGAEDLVTGKMISRYGSQHNLCIDHFDPLAWDHVRNVAARGKSVAKQW